MPSRSEDCLAVATASAHLLASLSLSKTFVLAPTYRPGPLPAKYCRHE